MKLGIIALSAGLLIGPAGSATSQSMAELAKKEKERRAKLAADAKVITNNQTSQYKSGAVTTGNLPQDEKKEKAVAPPPTGQKGSAEAMPDEPVDFEGRPESYWRQTFTDARQRIQDLENQSNVLILKQADLQNRFYREADGYRQQTIQREIQKTIYEQDRNREELQKAKDQLADLEKEARKSGALPGWMNPRKP